MGDASVIGSVAESVVATDVRQATGLQAAGQKDVKPDPPVETIVINPIITQQLAEIRRAELIAEADQYRRARHAGHGRASRRAAGTMHAGPALRRWWWKLAPPRRANLRPKEL